MRKPSPSQLRYFRQLASGQEPPRCPRCKLVLQPDGSCVACPVEDRAIDRYAMARVGEGNCFAVLP